MSVYVNIVKEEFTEEEAKLRKYASILKKEDLEDLADLVKAFLILEKDEQINKSLYISFSNHVNTEQRLLDLMDKCKKVADL